MRSAEHTFPWLVKLNCGCAFTRLETTDGKVHRHWDPCGSHVVLAATRFEPGWPPTVTRVPTHPIVHTV